MITESFNADFIISQAKKQEKKVQQYLLPRGMRLNFFFFCAVGCNWKVLVQINEIVH